jgi:penicillin-insensitive murein DD-endopeptidase
MLIACSGTEPPRAAPITRADPPPPPPAPVVAVEPPAPEPEPDPIAQILAMTGDESTSIGGPNEGRLEGGIALPEQAPGLVSNPRRPNSTAFYGTVELVQSLLRSAQIVETEIPGSVLYINDIGLPGGGPIPHHGSHRVGRDVDILFYLIDGHGEPMQPVGAFLDTRGRGYDFKDLADPRDDVLVRLDAPRTWRFVQALLETRGDEVQRIFLADHVRAMLLAQAQRTNAPREIRDRFAAITCQPSYPHDDHLHVRFFCTAQDIAAGCEDSTPIYEWRRAALAEVGVEPVLYRPRPDRPRAQTTSAEDARRAAGPMHERVQEWLQMREAWMHSTRGCH